MTTLLVISIILSIVAIILLWLFLSKLSELNKKAGQMENSIGFMKAELDELKKKDVLVQGLPGVSYNVNKKTMNVAGNLSVEGWVSAGSKEE